jgi:hypothetical protein
MFPPQSGSDNNRRNRGTTSPYTQRRCRDPSRTDVTTDSRYASYRRGDAMSIRFPGDFSRSGSLSGQSPKGPVPAISPDKGGGFGPPPTFRKEPPCVVTSRPLSQVESSWFSFSGMVRTVSGRRRAHTTRPRVEIGRSVVEWAGFFGAKDRAGSATADPVRADLRLGF